MRPLSKVPKGEADLGISPRVLGGGGGKDRFWDGLMYIAGQIIATSHDLTPNGGLVREIPLFQGNLGW